MKTDGTGSRRQVTFDASATTADVQNVIRQVSLKSTASTATSRQIQVQLTGQGFNSNVATRQVFLVKDVTP